MNPIAYDEIRMLVEQSGANQETREFWMRYLDNIYNATWMTEQERQRKLQILLDAIDAEHNAEYYNRFDVILRDTFKATFEDIKGAGEDILNVASSPLVWIALGGLGLLILAKKL